MKLINIFPLNNMVMEYSQYTHMFLTHMVEKYPLYEKIARECSGYKILDNSLIELGGSVDISRVIDVAERIGANEIILPDVFRSSHETLKTVESALKVIKEKYSEKRFTLMAVAQGDSVESWNECYKELLLNPEIDVIGVPKVYNPILNEKLYGLTKVKMEEAMRKSTLHELGDTSISTKLQGCRTPTG